MIMMNGKSCMVTGATAGIGLYTALGIAKLGASVILVGRNETKCIHAVKWIQETTGNPAVSHILADLSSQAQIRAAADEFSRLYDHLDVLVNNVGGFFLRRKLSVDGIEMTFALNHLSYFLLTNLLLEKLKASQSARVVNVSSGSHLQEHLDFSDLQMKRFYNPIGAYGRSKMANILFTNELARRLNGTKVTANSLTPGMVATEMWKKVNPLLTPILYPSIRMFGKSPQEGAQTSIYLASSPEVEGVTGEYFVNCHPASAALLTHDVAIAQQLWQVSSDLVNP